MIKLVKKLWKLAIKNYFITIIIGCVVFVFFVSSYELFFKKPAYIYVKMKVGQGLWWASTLQPPLWFVKSIRPGDVQTDLVGSPNAQILSVRYYPSYQENQYNAYVILKLKVSGNSKTGVYNFNHSTIGIGAPIDLEFPDSQFSGTIIDLSNKPIKNQYIDKVVYLYKDAAPWEYDAIKIGDKFFDGKDTMFEVLDKSSIDSQNLAYTNDLTKKTTVKAKIEVQKIDNKYIFGEEQTIAPGNHMTLVTNNFIFFDYIISKVE